MNSSKPSAAALAAAASANPYAAAAVAGAGANPFAVNPFAAAAAAASANPFAAAGLAAATANPYAAAAAATNPFQSSDSTAAIFQSADFLKSLDAYKESMNKTDTTGASDPAAFFRSADFLKSLDTLPKDRRQSVFKSIDFLQSLDYASTDGNKMKDVFASIDGKKFNKDLFASMDGKKFNKDLFASMDGKKFGKDIFSSIEGKNLFSSIDQKKLGAAFASQEVAAAAHKKQLKDILSSRDWGREYNPTGSTFNRALFESQDSVSSVSSVKSVSKMGKPLPPKKAGLVGYYNSCNSSDWMPAYQKGHTEVPYNRAIFRSEDSFKGEKPDPPSARGSRAASPSPRAASPVPPPAKKPASSASKWMKMYQAGLNKPAAIQAAAASAAAVGLPSSLRIPISLTGIPASLGGIPTSFTGLPSSIGLPASITIPPAAALKPAPKPVPPPAAAAAPPSASASPTPMDGVDGEPTKKPKKKRIYKSRKVIPDVKTYVDFNDNDVLLGRGGLSNKHPGNKRYRQEIENAKAVYRSASKDEKTEWANLLVEYVKKYGGRFLERDKVNGKWYIVPDVVARRKAGQALREDNTPESRKEKRDRYKKAHGKF